MKPGEGGFTPAPPLPHVEQGSSADGPQGPQVFTSVQPTARVGVMGGKPTGSPTDETKGDADTKRGHKRENQAANILAAKGHQVEQKPARSPADANAPGTKPDLRIGGNLFDVYSPSTDNMDTIRTEMSRKVSDQADRLVVNLRDSNKKPEDIARMLKSKPIKGLKEVLVTDKQGNVTRLFPQPGPTS